MFWLYLGQRYIIGIQVFYVQNLDTTDFYFYNTIVKGLRTVHRAKWRDIHHNNILYNNIRVMAWYNLTVIVKSLSKTLAR